MRRLQEQARPATRDEQQQLARWSSWGAIPQVFDEQNADWAAQREQLRGLLDERAYDAARRTTINAHYTDPAYVAQMWSTLQALGFTEGHVLEPGCGSGTFIGMAPPHARMIGVELDPTTATVARHLCPGAEIRTESFADTRLPPDHFDAVVGNVPFADVALHDPQFNAGRHSMHNHFIIKSLAMTRPGGLAVVLTSSFTMDAANPAARREMNALADLVGAVRLPSGAHRRAAGTEALTDLLILRRREPGTPPHDRSWETVTSLEVDGATVRINTYFDRHPERVLGQLRVGHGMYGAETLQVRTDDLAAVPDQLRGALRDVVDEARDRGQTFTGTAAAGAQPELAPTDLWDGTIVAAGGSFQVAHDGRLHDLAVPKAQHTELRHLLRLRDGARSLLDAEAADSGDSSALEQQRDRLRRDYRSYVARYGPINRFTLRRTGRYAEVLDPVTREPVVDPATGAPARR